MKIRNAKGFSLIEVLVAAAIVILAVFSVVAIIRKGQEQMYVEKHRRVARAIADSTLEGPRFYPGNYGLITCPSTTTDSLVLDATFGKPKAGRTITVAIDTLAGLPCKDIQVNLYWRELSYGAVDSVVIERAVPDIPDSMQNIALFADTITPSSTFTNFGNFSAGNVADGIICLKFNGDWASNGEVNPQIRLAWKNNHRIKKINLYDRCNANCAASNADVCFNDAATPFINITIPACPNCGQGNCSPGTAIFGPQVARSVTIKIHGIAGSVNYVGLSEVEIFE